jgi:uncharacterized protein
MAMNISQRFTATEVIEKLNLQPLSIEGGFFRQTYKNSSASIPARHFGIDSNSGRQISTAIYYLITKDDFSALHRVKSDEIFHFYCGDSVELIQVTKDGNVTRDLLGGNIFAGENPQIVVPKGNWQGLKLSGETRWALMGTTVAPGFEYEDFEIGIREELIEKFPSHRNLILEFTRESS